jgi:hypothetical protein
LLFSCVYVEQGRRYETFGRRSIQVTKWPPLDECGKTCRDAPLWILIRLADFSDFREHIFGVFQSSFLSAEAFTRLSLVCGTRRIFSRRHRFRVGRKSARNVSILSFESESNEYRGDAICRGVKWRDFRWVAALGFVKALNGLTSLLRNQHTAE